MSYLFFLILNSCKLMICFHLFWKKKNNLHYKSEIDYHLYSLDRILLICVIVKMHIHAIFEQIISTSRQNKVNSLRKWIRDRITITHECETIERIWIHAIFMSLISLSSINLQKKKNCNIKIRSKKSILRIWYKNIPLLNKKKSVNSN